MRFLDHLCGLATFAVLVCVSLLLIGISPRRACAHIGDYYNSVHFQSGKPDFGTPPRRAIIFWLGEEDDRPVTPVDAGSAWDDRRYVELTEDTYNTRLDRADRRREQLLKVADQEAAQAKWTNALAACRTLEREQAQTDGSLADRLEVLQGASQRRLRPGTPEALAVSRYLHALAVEEKGDDVHARETLLALSKDPNATSLRPNVLYQLASVAFEEHQYPWALTQYRQVLNSFPHTESANLFSS